MLQAVTCMTSEEARKLQYETFLQAVRDSSWVKELLARIKAQCLSSPTASFILVFDEPESHGDLKVALRYLSTYLGYEVKRCKAAQCYQVLWEGPPFEPI